MTRRHFCTPFYRARWLARQTRNLEVPVRTGQVPFSSVLLTRDTIKAAELAYSLTATFFNYS